MNLQISGFRISRPLLIAVVRVVVILVWSTSMVRSISAEPANASAAAPRPRVFELQLVGPDGKPVSRGKLAFVTVRLPSAEQVKVGEFVRANNYSARVKTDSDGKLAVELPKVAKYFSIDIEVPGYGPYWAAWRSAERSEDLPEKFVAELDAGWSVGGIVTDSDGKPVKGATINPSIEFKKRPGDESQLGVGTDVKTT